MLVCIGLYFKETMPLCRWGQVHDLLWGHVFANWLVKFAYLASRDTEKRTTLDLETVWIRSVNACLILLKSMAATWSSLCGICDLWVNYGGLHIHIATIRAYLSDIFEQIQRHSDDCFEGVAVFRVAQQCEWLFDFYLAGFCTLSCLPVGV